MTAILVLLLLLGASACGDDDDTSDRPAQVTGTGSDQLTVVATTTIIADLARNVAGNWANVTSLLPANADPHDFEPNPSDLGMAADADLILEHGLGLDTWAEGLIDESGADAPIAIVTTGVRTLAGDHTDHGDEAEDEGDEHGDEHGDVDPHVWFDVANAKAMTENIRDALSSTDPDHADAYATNATAYLVQLDELDAWVRDQISQVPEANRRVVSNHDAFGYYVDTYGLELVGTVIPSLDTQAQPSARELDALLDVIEEQGVRAILAENTVSPDLAETLASEADIAVVDDLYSDALGDSDSEAGTYIDMVRYDTARIVEALT